MYIRRPRPSHAGQAPCGLLNENRRGSISSMVKPDTGQANLADSSSCSPVSAFSTRSRPSEWLSAVSIELGEARLEPGRQHHAVDHQLDVVLELLVELRHRVQLVQLAVDLDPLEAGAQQLGELLAVLALAPAHDRRQQIEARALGQAHDPVDHLRDGLALDRQPGRGRIRDADPGVEQAQVVVDLGDRADRRARVPRRGLLLDRDRRRQAGDRSRRPASASARGTGGHRPRGSRRSGAGRRRRWCRTRARTCRSRTAR